MKIKVKLTGEYFPCDIRDTIQEVEITSIRLEDSANWSIDNNFYSIEAVNVTEEKKQDARIDFGDNKLKTLTVEFK